jgi:hypothetical protein
VLLTVRGVFLEDDAWIEDGIESSITELFVVDCVLLNCVVFVVLLIIYCFCTTIVPLKETLAEF